MRSTEMKAFVCGPPRDHKCDSKGPFLYGGDTVETTSDEKIARSTRGYTWGSATCSVCGMTAMDLSLWRDE